MKNGRIKTPILIIGYERSGTTLLRRIVSMHPFLDYEIYHEKFHRLKKSETIEEAEKRITAPAKKRGKETGSTMSIKAGQKIAYYDFEIAKKSVDKFKSLFGIFSLIHIVRHPVAAINSQIKTFRKNDKICIKTYFNSVPRVYQYIAEMDHLTVFFEKLLDSPFKTVQEIYEYIGYVPSDEYINKVITTKEVWRYKGRVMPGLRYFDDIKYHLPKILLKSGTENKIKRILEEKYESFSTIFK